MIHRRGLFKTLGAAAFLPATALARTIQARDLMRTGALGRIIFCRASDPRWLQFVYSVCPENRILAELDRADTRADQGAVFLGTNATLVVNRKGCQILP